MKETNVTVNITYLPLRYLFYVADLLNINPGCNEDLKEACKTLKDYAEYTARVRRYADGMNLEDAVEKAINECIGEGILSDFLMVNKAEAKKMSIYEYDEELHMQQTRAEGWEEGFSQGEAKGRIETILDFLKDLGTIPENMHKMIINQTDSTTLKQWVRLAAKVDSIEEFQNQISIR